MSFSVTKKGSAGEVVNGLQSETSIPDSVKAFARDAVNSLKLEGRHVKVAVYGHLHNGEAGNHEVSTASITVEPVEAEQPAVEGEQVEQKPAADAGIGSA